jgi:hypothetical protein
MQNERLFKKVKETALHDLSGTDDWEPDEIWAVVEKKSENRRILLWWPYAVASMFLLVIGLALWDLESLTRKDLVDVKPTVKDIPSVPTKTENHIDEISKRPEVGDNRILGRISPEFVNDRDQIIQKYETVDTSEYSILKNDLREGQIQTAVVFEDADSLKSAAVNEKVGEKVLIADIKLPEQKPEELTGLRYMFDLAKKEREARKMRVRILKRGKSIGLWSFVHHSFVEYPSMPETAPAEKNDN